MFAVDGEQDGALSAGFAARTGPVLAEDPGVDDPTVIDSIDALARRVVGRAGAPLRRSRR